jgi:hypothetical protein
MDPLDVARRAIAVLFLWMGIGGLAVFLATGEWRALALASAAWTLWGVISGLVAIVLEPFATMLANLLTGGTVGAGETGRHLTIDEEAAMLERGLDQGESPHHRILTGIRLAEIYRTRYRDHAKADALIARLCAQYPDAPELRFVRGS